MAEAAKRRHAVPAAAAQREWAEGQLMLAGTLLQHETDTTGSDTSGSSWKSCYTRFSGVEWPTACAFCELSPPTLAAHVSCVQYAGLFLVPCCGSCNANSNKALKRQSLVRDTWAQPLPGEEVERVLKVQAHPETAHLCAAQETTTKMPCARKVCAKDDCKGSSRRYCCAHCSCSKAGSMCGTRAIQAMEVTIGQPDTTSGPRADVETKTAAPVSPIADAPAAVPAAVPVASAAVTPVVVADRVPSSGRSSRPLTEHKQKPTRAETSTKRISEWVCAGCELSNPEATATCNVCSGARVRADVASEELTSVERLIRFVSTLPEFHALQLSTSKDGDRTFTNIEVKLRL
jgi:hypothetical protein